MKAKSIEELLKVDFERSTDSGYQPGSMERLPAIVIPCFNRLSSLTRLCTSIQSALAHSEELLSQGELNLIFSFDSGGSSDVNDFIERYQWSYGKKEIIRRQDGAGTDRNIFSCMGLVARYGSVLILEDDLFVSPGFLEYTVQSLDKYYNEPKVGGISLYDYSFNEEAHKPFYKSSNGDDIYFYQKVISWGWAISKPMVIAFQEWLIRNKELDHSFNHLPKYIRLWNDDVWDKWFNAYLVSTARYFVHPYRSFVTNFGDKGVHIKKGIYENIFQISLQSGIKRKFIFPEAEEAIKYDIFCELIHREFEMDLYGNKKSWLTDHDQVITSKKVSTFVRSYGRKLKPHELNISYEIPGTDFFLVLRADIKEGEKNITTRLREYYYYYPDFSILWLIRMKAYEIIKRFIKNG
jgi:hypothetical protein